MSRSAPLILLAVLLTACGGQGGTSQASPSPAASSSPSPSSASSPTPVVAGSYAVLASPSSGSTYNVILIDANGKEAANASAKGWNGPLTCAGVANALLPPPISTSNSKVYFEDAAGVVRSLDATGATATVTTVPNGTARRSIFSVSPDDKRIAVVVSDFGAGKAAIRLYVEDLKGHGHHVELFTQNATTSLWPIGWHAGSLVLAKVPTCTQGGGSLGCCSATELHVVNPANAVRRFTIGGPACIVSGPSTPIGTPCLTSANVARILDWSGVTMRTVQLPFQRFTYLSPDGQHLAYQTDGGTVFGGTSPLQMGVCGWIDNTHILDGGDLANGGHSGHIGDITTGTVTGIPYTATCAGRIPGGL